MDQEKSESKSDTPQSLPFWKVVLSVIRASFGVQNRSNRERDFQQQSFVPFIVAALIFTLLFVLALAFVVRLVLN